MAEWSDVANNLILLAKKHPVRALFIFIFAAVVGLFYVTHRPEEAKKGTVSIQTKGRQNQTAGTNNGAMVQENK
jgi:hypothetical protein